ncbi:MAG TPA: DUF1840 domain-containing protein [Burkholderiaceae bacterium]|jgi:hypothetical protein
MLVTFKSKAAAEVIMYKEHAKRILDLFNKDVERGVITAAETATALAKLNAAIEESRARATSNATPDASEQQGKYIDDDHERTATQSVSFATRAYPFLEMLRAAQKRGADIAWGI